MSPVGAKGRQILTEYKKVFLAVEVGTCGNVPLEENTSSLSQKWMSTFCLHHCKLI